ncbi:MAG: hypothetical protein ACRDID_16785 [Ktedonobacterales bacterium]
MRRCSAGSCAGGRWWTPEQPPQRRLALALDASLLNDRFTVLAVSVLYRGCAIPVAWLVLRANQAEACRGLYAPWLFRALVANGWHPLLRLTASAGTTSLYRPLSGGGWRRLSSVLPQVGASWAGQVVCFQQQPVTGTLLARWEAGHATGWVLLTDLAPEVGEVAWYALRSWIETGFKATKRGGWQWQATRMTDPGRVTRCWLAVAVATLWVVSVGSAAEDALPPCQLEALPLNHIARRQTRRPRAPRPVSCFRRGVLVVAQAGWTGQHCPIGRFIPEPWPTNHGAESQATPGHATTLRQKPTLESPRRGRGSGGEVSSPMAA